FEQDEEDFSIKLGAEEEDVLDLEPGGYYFYTILNLPGTFKTEVINLLEGKESSLTKDEFEQKVLNVTLEDITDEQKGFMMTNSTPPVFRAIYSEEQIKEDDTRSNEVVITAGRAAGKISFAYVASEVQTGELHGSLTDIKYTLLNNLSQMYLMPVIENDILLTPHYNGDYAADYFSPTAKDEDIKWLGATTIETINKNEPLTYGYCIENHNKTSLKSNSTMVLIKAKFIPAVWLNKDGTEGTSTTDGTFYRIGQFNTKGDLLAYTQGYYNEKPDAIVEELNNQIPASGPYKWVEYSNGITYYGFWPGNNGRHQVKRNNYYRIAITHIHEAGAPEPGDTIDPDTDPDDESTTGRIALYAVSWDEEYMEVIVGEDPAEDDEMIGGGGSVNPKPWEEEEDQEEHLGSGSENNIFN
ncbi:MAG: hypothetical protein LUD15_01135, partial [Bacteroides sp.]|nr:hypothetical protein [Bacteroides sp.]